LEEEASVKSVYSLMRENIEGYIRRSFKPVEVRAFKDGFKQRIIMEFMVL